MNIRFEPKGLYRLAAITAAALVVTSTGCAGVGDDEDVSSVAQAQTSLDATCVATITMDFDPPATRPIPPSSGPYSTADGTGTVSLCAVTDSGATSGTIRYHLEGAPGAAKGVSVPLEGWRR